MSKEIIAHRSSDVSTYVRTLLANGYQISNSHRQPNHIEISCQYRDIFGVLIPYLFIICQSGMPSQQDISAIREMALSNNQNVIVVCDGSSDDCISREEFFTVLGGLIPSWRALGSDYANALIESSHNRLPAGFEGEAWLAFEETVADGLEFLFGRRAIRLGGNKRGKKVSDIFIYLPDGHALIVDTKATSNKFDATWSNLRALSEYTKDHLIRQKGYFPVAASLLVAPQFKQNGPRLSDVANDFLSDTSIPLIFMTSNDLLNMTTSFGQHVILRNKINWKKVFQRNGLYNKKYLFEEISLLTQIVK